MDPAGAADSETETALASIQTGLLGIRQHMETDIGRIQRSIARQRSSPLSREADQAEQEIDRDGQPWGKQVAHDQLHYAGLAVHGSVYHLHSLGRLLQQPVSQHAVQVLVRAYLEAATRAWWLLEPMIGIRERVIRGLGEGLHRSREQLRALSRADSEDLAIAANQRVAFFIERAHKPNR